MKMTFHYANGKSFTTPALFGVDIRPRSIVSVRSLPLDCPVHIGDSVIKTIATGVSSIIDHPEWRSPTETQTVSLKKTQVERIDIKCRFGSIYDSDIIADAIEYGWRVSVRKLHNKETGYNVHITLFRPIL